MPAIKMKTSEFRSCLLFFDAVQWHVDQFVWNCSCGLRFVMFTIWQADIALCDDNNDICLSLQTRKKKERTSDSETFKIAQWTSMKEIAETKANEAKLEADLATCTDKDERIAIRKQISTHSESQSQIRQQAKPIQQRFSREWWLNGVDVMFWSGMAGGSTFVIAKRWGLPAVQARAAALTTGCLQLMHGVDGMRKRWGIWFVGLKHYARKKKRNTSSRFSSCRFHRKQFLSREALQSH